MSEPTPFESTPFETTPSESTPFEDELGDAMRRTGDTFRPTDRPALVDGGLRRGRRRLALRRSAAVTGSVLALAGVVLGGAYGGGLLGGDGAASVGAPDRPAPRGDKPNGKITKEQMIETLKGLLPEGRTSQEDGRGSLKEDGRSAPFASVVYDDGKGAAAISFALNTVDPDGNSAKDWTECPSRSQVPHDACTAKTLPDGSKFVMFQGYEYPDRRVETKNWRATLLTPSGVLLDANEYNAPAQKDAEVSRTDPPLTPEQMKALVTAAQWQPIMKELGEPVNEIPDPGEIGTDAARDALVSLLPKGLEVSDKGGQSGYAFVVVDDGKGKSFVQVNVQPGMLDVADQLISNGGDVTTLPDGTKVMQKKENAPDGKGGAGAVGWTVDTLRPDGFRVVITAFNTGAQGQDATRAEPALTMVQLKAIALDKKWLTLK
ncbi:hypothetical protein OG883_00490 [Streptomyces sp. NBC_01142]|uniref:hypothetical protein n=1 Tax=Streptomyces sp. NBC_01142 TaxID=2975865 RepID=UPI002259D49A|nr:hypothetical protein [Streptomyces sp. NBC_01142]MCX4818409.1 hypothetical protein [Streptomyces sp. NBC_01142]